MKVILLQDLPKLGKKYDIKDVNDGFARNFLLPKNLAKVADEQSLKTLEREKAAAEKKLSEDTAKFKELSSRLAGLNLMIKTKIGEKGKAFGAVTSAKIRDALEKEGIVVEKECIGLEGPIKKTGEAEVTIKFPHGITAKLKITVEAETN